MKNISKKILLIEPPFHRLYKSTFSLGRYPLALGYLTGTIKKKTDWEVKSYNADFFPRADSIRISYLTGVGFQNYLHSLVNASLPIWNEVRATISEVEPSVVGISTKSQNFASARIVARIVKELNKDTTVIVGGPHPSMVGQKILDCEDIDICVRGEGEITIIELLNAIEADRGFDHINGIVYRNDGLIVENKPRILIEDLDSLCFPFENAPSTLIHYERFPLRAFRSVFAIRGCPYNCFFCGSRNIWTRRVRFRSPSNVIEEIQRLQKIGLNFINFDDDTFGIKKQYITELCNSLIKHCPGVKWECEMHVKLVDEDIISLMRSAGCRIIRIGIESGNNKILSEIRKNITIEEALAACRLIRKHGIKVHAFFMVGFLQETEETLVDTINAMRKVKCDVLEYSIFTPYPGTEAFALCKEKGVIGDDYDVSLHNHQSPINSFCVNIGSQRFRYIASKIEKMVDRKNSINRIEQLFSLETLEKVHELGIAKSLQKSMNLFRRIM